MLVGEQELLGWYALVCGVEPALVTVDRPMQKSWEYSDASGRHLQPAQRANERG
jgi:hypothetical protein